MVKVFKEGLASIIIVTYNNAHLIRECLDSLLDQAYKEMEIIVVDNGSQDASCRLIEAGYAGRIKLIKNAANLGFARGNNVGINEANGEYIILINNDTKTDINCVQQLVEVANTDKMVGMCAAKLLNYRDHAIIDAAGHLIYKDGLNQGRGRFETDRGQYENIEETIYPPGCGALYKRKMLNEIGLFDEDFFAYGEDTDIGLRARLMGWKALYVPKAIIYHKISQTGGQYSAFKLFFVERNRLFVIFKNYPSLFIMCSFFYTALRYWTQLLSILQNKGASRKYIKNASFIIVLKTLIKAYFSFIAQIPRLLSKRSKVRGKRKISDKQFLDLFEKFGIDVKKITYNV